jgi:hypothetical protein
MKGRVMIEDELKEVLISLEDAISSSDGSTVSKYLICLDSLVNENKRVLDPQLKHYLTRRSYAKALMFLNAEGDIPKGLCSKKNA